MAEQIIKPDVNFINDIIASGGESVKKCFQCATCSVVCNVTPEDNPFPRKEMIHAQWGLKDRLFSNPDVWLCHQCSDCTAYCPRGAKPGEVLGAVRKLSIEHYATPSFLAKAVGSPKALLGLLAVPIIIFIAAIMWQGKTHQKIDVARGPKIRTSNRTKHVQSFNLVGTAQLGYFELMFFQNRMHGDDPEGSACYLLTIGEAVRR